MAKQRYINTKFWRDNYIQDLDPTEKLLFLYLLSNPDTNISGIYEIPIKIIAIDTGIDVEMVKKLFARLDNDDKVKYLDGWVAIKNFTGHQKVNPKIRVGITTELNKAPKTLVKWVILNSDIEYVYPIDTQSHLNTNTNLNTNLNTNINTENDTKQKSPKKKTNVFTPPTILEIADYIKEKGYTFEAEALYDYYKSKGWLVGKSKMKDWKSAVNNWNRNQSKFSNNFNKQDVLPEDIKAVEKTWNNGDTNE